MDSPEPGIARAEGPFAKAPGDLAGLRDRLAQVMWDDVGVIRDASEAGDGLEYLAGAPSAVDPVPADLAAITVPAGRWAVFAHHGLPSDIDHTVNYIYGAWLVKADARTAARMLVVNDFFMGYQI